MRENWTRNARGNTAGVMVVLCVHDVGKGDEAEPTHIGCIQGSIVQHDLDFLRAQLVVCNGLGGSVKHGRNMVFGGNVSRDRSLLSDGQRVFLDIALEDLGGSWRRGSG